MFGIILKVMVDHLHVVGVGKKNMRIECIVGNDRKRERDWLRMCVDVLRAETFWQSSR